MINKADSASSSFVVYLGAKNNNKINSQLIDPKVRKFFDAKNIKTYREIDAGDAISDLDFKKVEFSYFYEKILLDIHKTDGNIEVIPKYLVTIDKINCKLVCPQTNMQYDCISLNETPVLFFIYLDLNEILTFMRQCKND
jgi:hypothetical protein